MKISTDRTIRLTLEGDEQFVARAVSRPSDVRVDLIMVDMSDSADEVAVYAFGYLLRKDGREYGDRARDRAELTPAQRQYWRAMGEIRWLDDTERILSIIRAHDAPTSR